MHEIALEPVDRLQVTILMDNVIDPLLPDERSVTRLSWPEALARDAPTLPAQVAVEGAVP